MKPSIRLFLILLVFPAAVLLTGCSTSGSGSVSYGVYGGYGYPYYGYGYGDCCYNDIDRRRREATQERRELRRERATAQPVNNLSGRMGRPSGMQMSRPSRMPGRRGP